MKKISNLSVLIALAATLAARAAETAPAPDTNLLTPDFVAGEVLRHHPLLKASLANLEAMNARVPQASAWEDPRFGLDVQRYDTTRFDSFTDNEWSLTQTIPLSGRKTQRTAAATAEARGALAELHQRQLELTTRARTAFVRYANARTQLDLSRQTEALVRQFSENLRVKFESGAATQSDLIMAETELVKLLETRRDLERQFSDEQSQLNVLMNRPPQSPLPPPATLEFRELTLDLAQMQGHALRHRPELDAANRRVEAAQSRVGVARRAWIPEPELRIAARQFDGSGKAFNEYDTGIFFNIPWINRGKYRAATAEAAKSLEAAEHERDALAAGTLGHVRDQLKKIETFHHHYTLFRDRLVPLARQGIEAARSAYAGGKGGVLEVLTALRTAREVEAAHAQHLADYSIAVAELDGVIGMNPTAQTVTTKGAQP
ncbi:MAG: TolC family protein [Verrucomicrobia bacterium]|nr:TolC family protein [Verrucomicrobiota bacterium]